MNRWTRKLHRWGAIASAIPLLLVILTGLLLQFKKELPWVQPPTMRGAEEQPSLQWQEILEVSMAQQEAEVEGWEDIDRIDVRPSKGVIKVRCKNSWELQLDSSSGAVLSSAYRRSDLIESLHDGSFFSDFVKLYVFSANGLVLLGLWLTGAWLWYLPVSARKKKKKRQSEREEKTEPDR